jgi:hypothetical protein
MASFFHLIQLIPLPVVLLDPHQKEFIIFSSSSPGDSGSKIELIQYAGIACATDLTNNISCFFY